MFSEETRHHLVRLVMHDHATVAFAARSLRVSTRSATRYLMYYRETGGAVHSDPAMWNRHCDNVRDDEQLRDAVLVAVEEHPEMFLDEMAAAVAHVAELVAPRVSVSVSSVSRVLAHNDFTRKIIEKAFFTRNEAQRAAWVELQWRIPLRCLVHVDEAHRCGRAAERRWAWAHRGERAECYVESSRGVRTSFLVAMAHDEVLDWLITRPPPGQSSVDFLLFVVSFLLPRMTAYDATREWDAQERRCVLVLDNARVHDQLALTRVRAAGVFVMLLPPYSPDFNLIEDVFSVGSCWLRRYISPQQYNVWPLTTIDGMLSHITGDMCADFVRAAVRRYILYVR